MLIISKVYSHTKSA